MLRFSVQVERVARTCPLRRSPGRSREERAVLISTGSNVLQSRSVAAESGIKDIRKVKDGIHEIGSERVGEA